MPLSVVRTILSDPLKTETEYIGTKKDLTPQYAAARCSVESADLSVTLSPNSYERRALDTRREAPRHLWCRRPKCRVITRHAFYARGLFPYRLNDLHKSTYRLNDLHEPMDKY